MKCPNCGAPVSSREHFCSYCHTEVFPASKKLEQPVNQKVIEPSDLKPSEKTTEENSSFFWGCIGFAFPLLGLILYFVWNKDNPKNAKGAGIGALLGFLFYAFNIGTFSIFPFLRIFRIFR